MAAPAPSIESAFHEGILVLKVKQTVLDDFEQVQRIRDALVAAVAEASGDVVLDLRNVEYMTSVALLPFVEVRSAAEARGSRVVLCNLTDIVAKVLTVSQLIVESSHGNYLEIAGDLDSAIALLRDTNV